MNVIEKAYWCDNCILLSMVNYRVCPSCGHDHGGEGWIRNYKGSGESAYIFSDEELKYGKLAVMCHTCHRMYVRGEDNQLHPDCECRPTLPQEVIL